jgi:ketosteroid isomerase-like protein
MTPTTDLAVELLRRVNQREVEAAAALFHPAAELYFPRYAPRNVYRGAELLEFLDWLTETFPVSTFAIDRLTPGETGVTVEFEVAGTSRAGHEFDATGALVLDVHDGLIAAVL